MCSISTPAGPTKRGWTGVLQCGLEGAQALLFPQVCGACTTALGPDERLCGPCGDALDLLRAEPGCPRCGTRPPVALALDGRCGACRERRLHFDATVCVGAYRGALKQLLLRFKFGGALDLDALAGDWLLAAAGEAEWARDIDLVVAVPAHWWTRWQVRARPAELLGSRLARGLGRPFRSAVRRVRLDPRQMSLPLRARSANVRGAFDVPRPCQVRGRCVGLVDDVMTSGATLDEVAGALKSAGARFVGNIVLARGGSGVLN